MYRRSQLLMQQYLSQEAQSRKVDEDSSRRSRFTSADTSEHTSTSWKKCEETRGVMFSPSKILSDYIIE